MFFLLCNNVHDDVTNFLLCNNVHDDVTNFLVCNFMEHTKIEAYWEWGEIFLQVKNDFTLVAMLCQKITF